MREGLMERYVRGHDFDGENPLSEIGSSRYLLQR